MGDPRAPDPPSFLTTQVREFLREVLTELSAGKPASKNRDWPHGMPAQVARKLGVRLNFLTMVLDGDRGVGEDTLLAITSRYPALASYFVDRLWAGRSYRGLYPAGLPGLTERSTPAQPFAPAAPQPPPVVEHRSVVIVDDAGPTDRPFGFLAENPPTAAELRIVGTEPGIRTADELRLALNVLRRGRGESEQERAADVKRELANQRAKESAVRRGGRQIGKARPRPRHESRSTKKAD